VGDVATVLVIVDVVVTTAVLVVDDVEVTTVVMVVVLEGVVLVVGREDVSGGTGMTQADNRMRRTTKDASRNRG